MDGTRRPKTRRQVNAHIHANGHAGKGFCVYRGNGYFYFHGDGTDNWYSTMVCVNRLDDLTLDGWLAAFEALAADCR